jgi:hypothetical protein
VRAVISSAGASRADEEFEGWASAGPAPGLLAEEPCAKPQALPPAALGFTQLFRRGQRSFIAEVGYTRQHNFPEGPRSKLGGGGLSVAQMRFSSRKVEKGIELGLQSLSSCVASTRAWEISGLRKQYYRIRPRYAAFWEAGLGLCFLTDLVPEQSTHANFTEFAGTGIAWRMNPHAALTAQYRFVHVSNAGLDEPNIGLNCSQLRLGWTVYF